MLKPSAELARLRDCAARAGIPLQAQMEVTHRCNLACAHCYLSGHREAHDDELSLTEIESVLDQLAEMGTLFISFTGGEFFIREDAFEILAAAYLRNFAVIILTNGTLIGAEEIKRIAALQPLQVHVSLLGMEKSHDRIAGCNGAFARTIETIHGLRNAGIRTVVKAIITKESMTDTIELKQFAAQIATEVRMTADLLPGIDGRRYTKNLQLCANDLCKLADGGKKNVPSLRWNPEDSICNAARSIIAFDPYGAVVPCIAFRMESGNIRNNKVADLWNSSKMESVRKARRLDLNYCINCKSQPFCTYCPGQSWQEHGDLSVPARNTCDRAQRNHKIYENGNRD